MYRFVKISLLIATVLIQQVSAQIMMPANTPVTQNFNTIGSSATAALPANWKMSAAGNGAAATWATGSNITATTQAASSGTPVTGGAYNWATSTGTDRAIGFMTDGAYTSANSIMAFYLNTTGSTITSVTIKFSIERYRTNTSPFTLSFFSSIDGSTWAARTAGDISSGGFATGTSSYSFATPQTIYRTVTITGLSIANNGAFYLRWLFTTGNTNSQGVALDDVSVFAEPTAPLLTATLQDALTIDNGVIGQANPGDQLTYTTKIKNNGSGNASNVTLTAPAPTNTTLVGGSITTSAVAVDDSYSTNVNTALNGATVLVNDIGLPSLTVLSFGNSTNSSAVVANGSNTATTDNGGTILMNTNGTFTYTPATGFTGIDRFAYTAGTGTLPNNDAIVTVTVGTAASSTNDSYSVTGNISISRNAASGVLLNDAGNNVAVTAVNGNIANVGAAITTIQGGNLTLNADGSFSYNPPPGFEGADNFTYTIDNSFGVTSTATVTLNISGMIWFINNAAGSTGDGRLSSPFNTLAAFTSVNNGTGNNPAAGDNIFIYTGSGSYTGGTALLNNQRLIGQGTSVSIEAATAITLATGSASLPTTGGTNPAIINAAGNGIAVAQGNTIRGLSIGNCSGNSLSGNTFGTLTVNETAINTTGQAISLTTGTLNASFSSVSSSGGVSGILLSGVAGSTTIAAGTITGNSGASISISGGTTSLTYSGSITQSNNAAMVNVSGGHTTGTITFQTGTISATNGTGLQFDNADGIYNFNGTTILNGGDAGIDIINGSSGTFTFATGTSITNPSGSAFNIGGTANTAAVTYNGSISKNSTNATVNITNHATGAVTFQTGTITATNGTGLQFDNADATYNFTGAVTLNGGDAGIDIINGSNGNFSFINAPITNPSGVAFLVNGGAGSVGHTGAISKTSAGRLIDIQSRSGGSVTINSNLSATVSATGINVSNCTGGTITFAGSTKTMNTPGSNPVNLTTNTGATINFSNGGLAITSTTATGFNATGGGTISVTTGANTNTIASTTGTALNVANTTIAAAGLNFRSVASNGASSGIVLNTTGSGGLTISGDGGGANNGSGGTIQNSTGTAISLISASNISLNYMIIQGSGDDGVFCQSVTNYSMNRCNVTNNGNTVNNDCGIDFGTSGSASPLGVFGTVSVTNSSITGNYSNQIFMGNQSGSATVTITSCTITGNAGNDNNDGILITPNGTASVTAIIQNSTFSANKGDHFQASGANSANMNITYQNNTHTGGHPTALGQGITLGAATGVPGYNGTVTYTISGNTFNGSILSAITVNLGTSANTALMSGTISNNIIGTSGSFQSGSTQASGIAVDAHGNGTHTLLITGNNIFQCFDRGINVLANDGSGVLNLTVQSNNINHSDGINSREAFFVNNGSTSPNIFGVPDAHFACINLGGAGALANTLTHGPGAPDDFRLRQRFNSTIRLPGYAGTATDVTAVVAFIRAQNTGSAGEPGSATVNSPPGGGFVGGAACNLP
jgi:hypothetical protein